MASIEFDATEDRAGNVYLRERATGVTVTLSRDMMDAVWGLQQPDDTEESDDSYDDGYDDGRTVGYRSGYTDGYRDHEAGREFRATVGKTAA